MIDGEKSLRAISGISGRRSTATNQGGGSKAIRRAARCCAECLEGRILFAWDMALSLNSTFKVASSTVSGVTTFTATGKNANLSWTSVQSALQAGDSVVISSGSTGTEAGNITDQTGFQLAFSAANLKLTIETGSGAGLIGNISLDNISLSGNGSSLVLGAAGNISCGLLSGGSSNDPAPLSSAVLTAAAGSVVQQSSPPDAIDADILAISASTGIGSSAAPFVTQTSNLSGQTTTGGIYLSNTGPVNISGGAIAGVNGLQVMTSGDLAMTNTGSISITNNADVVRAPGNLTITATGATADLQTGGNNGSSGGAIEAGGTASLTAGRDLLIGSPTSGYGNLDGGSNVTLNAGGNLVLDGGSSVTAHSASSISASVGGNITLSTSADQIETDSGAISLTTGTGGTFTDNGAINTAASGAGASITVSTGNVAENGPVIAGIGTIIVQSGGAVSAGSNGTVSAQTVAIEASTGIGSISAPLSTQTGNLSAKTATVGIYISNTGDLAIGGLVIPGVSGVQVTTSGDIQLTDAGSISFPTNANIAKGPGNVTVTATGAASDVQTGGNNNGANGNGAVQAGSSASISAGRDLLIGSLSLGYGDVEGGGGVVLNAGRNLILNDGSVVAAHGAGTVSATAGANITLSSKFDQILCDNAAITLAAGASGALTNNGVINSAYSGTGAPITISAGNVVLNNWIIARSGAVIIESYASVSDTGYFINADTLAIQALTGIGSVGTPLNTDVSNVSAATDTGGIYISNFGNLSITGGVIPGVNGLQAATSGDIQLANSGNISITNAGDVVQTPGSINLTAATGGTLTINSNSTRLGDNSLSTTGNGNITISTDHFVLAATDDIAAGTGVITIQPVTTTEAIQLGNTADAELDLSNAELMNITAGVLRIGSASVTGNITVTAAVGTPSVPTLALQTGGSISDDAPADTIKASSLAAQAGGAISLDTQVSNVAARGANIRIANSGALTVTAVDTLNGLMGAPITISADAIAINAPVYAGTIGAVTLTPTSGDVNLASGQSITGGSITQTAGASTSSYAGTLTASSGGLHLTGNNFTLAGPITDTGSLVLNDAGTATLTGSLAVSGPIIMNGAGAFQLNSRLPATVSLAANAGTTTIGANPGTGIRELNFTALNVAAGAKLVFANSSATLGDYSNHANRTLAIVDAGGLNIASGATLDIGDNSMLLRYASANKAATDAMVSSLVTSGYAGGAWSGTGITSSEANYDAFNGAAARAVGWADQLDVGVNSFEGDSADVADGNEIMIKFTYYGDSDLDGRVAFSDSANFSTGVHFPGNAYWEFGDFDYSGGKPTASDSQLFSTGLAAYKTFGLL